jgi:hypothetical protein
MRFSSKVRRVSFVHAIFILWWKHALHHLQLCGTRRKLNDTFGLLRNDQFIIQFIDSLSSLSDDDRTDLLHSWRQTRKQQDCYCSFSRNSYPNNYSTYIWMGSQHNYDAMMCVVFELGEISGHRKHFIVELNSKFVSFRSKCNWA